MSDDRAVQALDDAWKYGEAAGRGIICVVDEDVDGCTFHPIDTWGVDRGLDVTPVEIDACTLGEVVEGTGETEDVPEKGAGGSDLVDVEAGVDAGDGVVDVVPKVAAGG